MPTKKKEEEPDLELMNCADENTLAELARRRGKELKEARELLGDVLQGQDILTDKKWKKRARVLLGEE